MFDGLQWIPAVAPGGTAGEFVEHPAGIRPRRYLIVAAGVFNNQGKNVGPAYNDLTAIQDTADPTLFTMPFGRSGGTPADGYQNPTPAGTTAPRFWYIVKAIGFTEKAVAVCTVRGFNDKGILLRVALPNGRPSESGFMVEVSLFGGF